MSALTVHEPASSARALRVTIPRECREKSFVKASLISLRLIALYALFMTMIVWPSDILALQIVGSVLLGVAQVKWFELGHEALHLHFSGSPRFDRVLATLLLAPTLKPTAPTIYSHVQRHHRYTNIKGYDSQWSPISLADYHKLSPARRWLERVYRSLPGLGMYWGLEVVLAYHTRRGLHFSDEVQPSRTLKMAFARDRSFVYLYILANLVGWPLLAQAQGKPLALYLILGFIAPLFLAYWFIGASTYMQHTSERVAWFESPAEASFLQTQLAGSVDLLPPNFLMAVTFSKERPHAAHHIDMTVPMYNLRPAQDAIDARYPHGWPREMFSMSVLWRTVKCCKLYDFDQRRWLDFSGRPTTASLASASAPSQRAHAGDPGALDASGAEPRALSHQRGSPTGRSGRNRR